MEIILELYPMLFVKRREDPSFLPFPYATPSSFCGEHKKRKEGNFSLAVEDHYGSWLAGILLKVSFE